MTDYQGNSHKQKEEKEKKPAKVVERVVAGEVIVHKKKLGKKFKDLFVAADIRSVIRRVGTDVLIPAARNMMVDSVQRGIEWIAYPDGGRRRGIHGGPRITYHTPVNRGIQTVIGAARNAPPISTEPRALGGRHTPDTIILTDRSEAELVLERMNDIIDHFEVATMADLYDLIGLEGSHTDNKWGWVNLHNVPIRQMREGYLIDFPPPDYIQ